MSEVLPPLPPVIEKFIRETENLSGLKQSTGYAEFLSALDELRALNYLDILNSQEQVAILTAVGEGRALQRVARMVDERLDEGRTLTERFDGATDAFRRRREAERRAYATTGAAGPRRSFDSG